MALSNEQKNKMWALLNQTRGQIGLTAYKDYIFGLLFQSRILLPQRLPELMYISS